MVGVSLTLDGAARVKWSMVDGQWSMVHGLWAIVDGPWSMGYGRWAMGYAKAMGDGLRAMSLCFLLFALALCRRQRG